MPVPGDGLWERVRDPLAEEAHTLPEATTGQRSAAAVARWKERENEVEHRAWLGLGSRCGWEPEAGLGLRRGLLHSSLLLYRAHLSQYIESMRITCTRGAFLLTSLVS